TSASCTVSGSAPTLRVTCPGSWTARAPSAPRPPSAGYPNGCAPPTRTSGYLPTPGWICGAARTSPPRSQSDPENFHAPPRRTRRHSAGRSAATTEAPPGMALIIIATAQLMLVLDDTIVNVALPSMQRSLQIATPHLNWVASFYALAFGGLLLAGGRAGDLF